MSISDKLFEWNSVISALQFARECFLARGISKLPRLENRDLIPSHKKTCDHLLKKYQSGGNPGDQLIQNLEDQLLVEFYKFKSDLEEIFPEKKFPEILRENLRGIFFFNAENYLFNILDYYKKLIELAKLKSQIPPKEIRYKRGLTKAALAKELGLSRSTFYRKLKDDERFKVSLLEDDRNKGKYMMEVSIFNEYKRNSVP